MVCVKVAEAFAVRGTACISPCGCILIAGGILTLPIPVVLAVGGVSPAVSVLLCTGAGGVTLLENFEADAVWNSPEGRSTFAGLKVAPICGCGSPLLAGACCLLFGVRLAPLDGTDILPPVDGTERLLPDSNSPDADTLDED